MRNLLNTRVNLLDDDEIKSLGLTKGAISPFVINQNFVAIIDQAVLEIEWMTFFRRKIGTRPGNALSESIRATEDLQIAQIRSTSSN